MLEWEFAVGKATTAANNTISYTNNTDTTIILGDLLIRNIHILQESLYAAISYHHNCLFPHHHHHHQSTSTQDRPTIFYNSRSSARVTFSFLLLCPPEFYPDLFRCGFGKRLIGTKNCADLKKCRLQI